MKLSGNGGARRSNGSGPARVCRLTCRTASLTSICGVLSEPWPPGQRAAVALYYLEDMPIAEVADIVGCSESTVSVHLHRARHRLAEIVGEEVETNVD